MADKIVTLKDKNGDSLYPMTQYNSVTDANGEALPSDFTKIVEYTSVTSATQSTLLDNYYTKNQTNNLISNPNLLINGDFQINQRGQTTYTSGNRYTVDRWINRDSNATVSVITGGVRLECVSAGACGFTQSIENYACLYGKTLTLSIKVKAYDGTWRLGAYGGNQAIYQTTEVDSVQITSTGITSVTFDFDSSSLGGRPRFNVGLYKDASVGNYIEIEYIKLEVGSVATPLSPLPYIQEYNNCLRYYQKYNGNISAVAASSTSELYPEISLPTRLRTRDNGNNDVPTISVATNYVIRGEGSQLSGTPTISISTGESDLSSNGLELKVSGLGSVFTQYKCYSLHNGKLVFDAEIY